MTVTVFQALVLGIVQGLTELLPISSTGHLIIVPQFLHWGQHPLVFDTTLHLGTAAALMLFFWKELYKIVCNLMQDFFKFKYDIKYYSQESWLGFKILAGSIPAAVIGVLFGDQIENFFRNMLSVAIFILAGAVLMFIAEKFYKGSLENIKLKTSFFIGLFQALALLPGFSRSGSTISGAMLMGTKREEAARFSFLLSIPIVLGAGLFELRHAAGTLHDVSVTALTVGFLASLISGLVAINFLLKFLKDHKLYVFVGYRVLLFLVLILFLVL
jgi:undecaprenyl-diphosphatase